MPPAAQDDAATHTARPSSSATSFAHDLVLHLNRTGAVTDHPPHRRRLRRRPDRHQSRRPQSFTRRIPDRACRTPAPTPARFTARRRQARTARSQNRHHHRPHHHRNRPRLLGLRPLRRPHPHRSSKSTAKTGRSSATPRCSPARTTTSPSKATAPPASSTSPSPPPRTRT